MSAILGPVPAPWVTPDLQNGQRLMWLSRNGEVEQVAVWPGRPDHPYEVYVPAEAVHVGFGSVAFDTRHEAEERAARYLAKGLRTLVRRLANLGVPVAAVVDGREVLSASYAERFGLSGPGRVESGTLDR